MKKLIIFTVLSLLSLVLQAQNSADKKPENTDDNERINAYLEYAKKYQTDSTESALKYLKKGIEIAETNHLISDSIIKLFFLTGEIYYTNNRLDSAEFYMRKSIEKAAGLKNNLFSAEAYRALGNILYNKSEFVKSLEAFKKSLKFASSVKDSVLTADILIDKAYTHDILSERDSALYMLEKANDISKKIDYTAGTGKSELAAGNIYYGINKFDIALLHYKNALNAALKSENIMGIAASYKNIAAVYIEKKEYDSAIKNLRFSLKEYQKLNYPVMLSNVYNDFSLIYSQKGQKDSVKYYLTKSITISKKYGTREDLSIAYNIAGVSYGNLKEYYLSNLYLDSCILPAKEIKFGLMLEKTYKTYSENLYALNKYKESLFYYKKYNAVKDSISNESFRNKLAQYQAEYESFQQESEIMQLKDKELIDKANNRLLIFGIFSLIIIFILIIVRIQTKRKKDAEIQRQKIILHKKEKELINAKLEQKEIEEKRLKNEIEFKTKQLAGHALNMMQKNKLLQELTEKISEHSKKLNTEGKEQLHSVKKQLEAGLNVDKDWDLFKIYFEQINESFFDKLKEINPNLTGNDYRLCALTKLNMSLKETASVLNISPESVKNARYRLKKKLKLDGKQSLIQFINEIN